MSNFTRELSVDEAIQSGVAIHQSGNLTEAQSIYDQILAQVQHPVAFSMRGLIAHQQGDNALAVTLISRAVELDPKNAVAHCNLGSVLMAMERHDQAAAHLETAVRLSPTFIGAHFNLANAYAALGRKGDAIRYYERTIQLAPRHVGAMMNLASIHNDLGEYGTATYLLRSVIEIDANHAEAYNNLGAIVGRAGMWDEAIKSYEKAIAIRPDYAEALNNLGALYIDMGNKEKARDCFSQVPLMQPDFHSADSNRLFLMHYEEQWTSAQLLAEAVAWEARHAPLSSRLPAAPVDKNPQRRLRIGYVSADLRDHPVGYFMESVLSQHAASNQCDIFCYSNAAMEDDYTRRMQRQHTWRRIYGYTDEQAAKMIRDDKIDILIDLAGHTAHNRLILFGKKPSPVAMTYLGYFDTTGLSAIDYILCDKNMLPSASEKYFVEKPLRLPDSYLCYTPPVADVAIKPAPAAANGYVTFGCFNKINKISMETFRAWAQILKQTPGSKIFLKNYWLNDEKIAGAVRENLTIFGIEKERIILEAYSPHLEYLESYNRMDIALDPLLYSGGTTTAEALWMGTPVIASPSERFVSRTSSSLLATTGCPELIAGSVEDYIAKACALAADVAKIQHYKTHLRTQFLASPMCDAPRFVANLENAYRQVWTDFCRTPS